MISKSLGTTVSGKTSRASRAISGPKYRFERCVSASMRTPAAAASPAAPAAVECAVSSARSRSSSAKVASWTRTSASFATSRTLAAGAVSPAKTILRPGRGGPRTCSGRTSPPSGKLDGLAGLESAEERPLGDAERSRGLDVEAAGARKLDERVAVGGDAVRDLEGDDAVVPAVDHVAVTQLHELDRVAQLPEDPLQRAEEVAQPGRPVDRERELTAAERERLQHPRQAEVVIRVVVREEHLGELDQPDGGAQELALGALAAVDEHPLAATPDQRPGEPAASRGNRARRPEEDQIEIHGGSLGAARSTWPRAPEPSPSRPRRNATRIQLFGRGRSPRTAPR